MNFFGIGKSQGWSCHTWRQSGWSIGFWQVLWWRLKMLLWNCDCCPVRGRTRDFTGHVVISTQCKSCFISHLWV